MPPTWGWRLRSRAPKTPQGIADAGTHAVLSTELKTKTPALSPSRTNRNACRIFGEYEYPHTNVEK